MKMKLYEFGPTRSIRVRWTLQELGVDFDMTLSCYDPSPAGEPCGRCDACQLRAKGFAEASV